MKNIQKALAYLLCLCMLLPLLTQLPVLAEDLTGTGTPDDPYLLYTPEDVLSIEQDLAGHYLLMADIDMSSVGLFTPVGTDETGPFTGVIDGSNHTISGLFIYHPDAKASGFVAYNEGTIRNLVIDAEVCGGRYTGGIAAYNSGTIDNCAMQGKVYTYGSPLETAIGGIVGYNAGTVQKCVNFSNVESNAEFIAYRYVYLGGIIGINDSVQPITLCMNFGRALVNKYSYSYYDIAGGIVGYSLNTALTIMDSQNFGNVSAGNSAGGIVGTINTNVHSMDCKNHGEITSESYSGGFCGHFKDHVSITEFRVDGFINTGLISSSDFASGCIGFHSLAGSNTSAKMIMMITNSCNAGRINGTRYASGFYNSYSSNLYNRIIRICIENSLNSGMVKGKLSSAFVLCYGTDQTGDPSFSTNNGYTKNCANTGIVIETIEGAAFTVTTSGENCLNSGLIKIQTGPIAYHSAGSYGNPAWINSYAEAGSISNINVYTYNKNVSMIEKSAYALSDSATYTGWDFDEIWTIDRDINGGLPYLKTLKAYYASKQKFYLYMGDVIELSPLLENTNNVSWESSDPDIVTVDKNGIITAQNAGLAMITSTDENRVKINFIVIVYGDSQSQITDDFDGTINLESSETIVFKSFNTSDSICDILTTGDNVDITHKGNSKLTIKAISSGSGTITIETLTGVKYSVPYTVTSNVTSLTLPSSATVNRGGTNQLTLTRTPTASTTPVTWSSSDTNIATVDQNGVVTGVALGSVTITAKAENGVSAVSTVTVKAPVETLDLDRTAITLTVGEKDQLTSLFTPLDTTDTITYSTSSSTYVSVVSSTGVITANRAGTATITATSSGGRTDLYAGILDLCCFYSHNTLGRSAAAGSGGRTAKCIVTVKAAQVKDTGVKISSAAVDMGVNTTQTLTATVTPSTASQKVEWESSNPTVVSVDAFGVLRSHKRGQAVITARSVNGFTAQCVVTVIGSGDEKYTVSFYDYDDTLISSQSVSYGLDAVPPENPVRAGYSFIGWSRDYTCVDENLTIYARYSKIVTSNRLAVFTTGGGDCRYCL